MTTVSDQIYLYLSEDAYRLKHDKVPPNIMYIVNGEAKEWAFVTDKKWTTHDPRTGFDAFVVKRGDELVVAFRGTQGDDLLGEGYADVITDIEYIVGKKPVHQEFPNPRGDRTDLYYNQEKGTWYKPNQFQQAEKLIKDVKAKYPQANITTTGHSLGGAAAQYSAAMFGLSAVTYSAPTVMDLLPESIRKKAERGDFDSSIVNYVHPKDSIGAGAIEAYERHIGSTFYIGSKYKYENAEKANDPIGRFIESISGSNYHNMKHYQFDQYGNISNPVILDVLNGREISRSPRYRGNDHGKLEVVPNDLRHVAESLSRLGKMFNQEYPHVYGRLKYNLMSSSDCPETKSVGQEVLRDMVKLNGLIDRKTSSMVQFLRKTADEYEEADKMK